MPGRSGYHDDTVFDFDSYLQRALPTPGGWLPTDLPRAAVLCPIVTHAQADHVLFVKRPEGSNAHAGQIGFPGGMHEADETPLETAAREALEEVGAPPTAITPLGELAPRESSSGIHVHCVVARLAPFELRCDPTEVERVLFVPLAELLLADRWQELPPPDGAPQNIPSTSPHFRFDRDLIWGLTGRFAHDLVTTLEVS